MFNSLLFLSLFTVVLAADELVVSVTAPASVASISQIFLQATVTNPGADAIRVVKYGTVLDNLPTNSFTVSKNAQDVAFTGITITVDATVDGAWVTIPAGGSLSANHTVAGLYDFKTAGTGTFTFAPFTKFRTQNNDIITASSTPATVNVVSDVEKRPVYPTTGPTTQTSTPVCSDGNRLNFMAAALSEGRALAGGAATNIQQQPNSQQWIAYFNGNAQSDIWYNFDRIAGDLATWGNRNLYCVDRAGGACNNAGVVAYTLLVTSGSTLISSDIYFCSGFWGLPASSALCSGSSYSRGGVVLHELSHAVVRTNDIVYGCSGAINLSPADKRNNADNYLCMSQDVYGAHNC